MMSLDKIEQRFQYVRSDLFEVSDEIPLSVLIGSVSDFDVECKRVFRVIRLVSNWTSLLLSFWISEFESGIW
jgi:hypothetical protein